MGGGWAERRVINVVGDEATGKTLLAIEAAANFIMKYPDGIVRYREREFAFDEEYAEKLGLPLDRMDFGDQLNTVEDLERDIEAVAKEDYPAQLYIVDSLDSYSDEDELSRDIGKATYGAAKAKAMSELFRRCMAIVSKCNMTLMFVSQTRENIGVMFGRKYSRSGGKALNFYCSQIVYLASIGKIDKTVKGIKRPIGTEIRAKVTKNKVGTPYREAQFIITFGYGVEDEAASLAFLKKINAPASTAKLSGDKLRLVTAEHWHKLEEAFTTERRKYA